MSITDRSPRPSGQTHLLRMVEAFLKRTKMAPSKFGREALGDSNLMLQLKQGRELRSATTTRILKFMAAVEGPPTRRPRKPPKGGRGTRASPPG
jgi:hypothetical protein